MLDCGNLPFYVCVYQRGYCRYWWVLKLLAIGQAKSDDTNSIGIRNVCVLFSEALQMVHVSYMLTVSVSKIPHKHDDRDIQLFRGMVTSLVSLFSSVYSCWWVCSVVFTAIGESVQQCFQLPDQCLCVCSVWHRGSGELQCLYTFSAGSWTRGCWSTVPACSVTFYCYNNGPVCSYSMGIFVHLSFQHTQKKRQKCLKYDHQYF